jgi:hypothetical protein
LQELKGSTGGTMQRGLLVVLGLLAVGVLGELTFQVYFLTSLSVISLSPLFSLTAFVSDHFVLSINFQTPYHAISPSLLCRPPY